LTFVVAASSSRDSPTLRADSFDIPRRATTKRDILVDAPWPRVFTATQQWASAHRGKWGQLTPRKMDEKSKSENMQKDQFSMFMLYFESNQGRQV